MKTTLIVLTLNEVEGVRALFPRLPLTAVDECLVVDGGSKDGTVEFFAEKGIRVVPQAQRGRGNAFLVGASEAKGDMLVFFSPDGNEDPDAIIKLIAAVEAGHELAICSRFIQGSWYDEGDRALPLRKWGNQATTFLINTLWHGSITDPINGLRAIRTGTFRRMNLSAGGFLIELQMSIRALKMGVQPFEIPTREGARIGGQNKSNALKFGQLAFKIILNELTVGDKFMNGAHAERVQK